MAKTHPHIDTPTVEQLRDLVEERPEPLVDVYLALHEIVISTRPDVVTSVDTVDASIGYAAHQFGYNGWGMAAVTPFGKWVSLTLLHGADLADPAGLLSGTSRMRHIKISDPAEVAKHRDSISALIAAAAELHPEG